MASRQQLTEQDVTEKQPEAISDEAMGPAVLASAASVGLSLYYYFIRGDRQLGTFVGLWPPTILAFASYFNQRKMRRQLETLTQPGTKLREAFDSMMGNR
ncbi:MULTISPECIES: hypothetical protein [Natrinema]|uniref:Uncharacterized protein n=2 Tax=Natrinema TaxID=88723 RepID=M0C4K2_9EURY|nr:MULTISPECIES: hypothetical protein [Natrinema]ELZ17583.1 hypothetical protein C476_14943 [Natrinema limicola JCM 13563]RZV08235.1 hypothetical protein BDK88_3202 [Natrinema hispanicum]SDC59502.1 hypothetical protein SAMN05192552_1005124 [Natrinema hispanicum]SET80173.1 hypothetical protein SAMN04488694_11316 [Natrinema hispanicum]